MKRVCGEEGRSAGYSSGSSLVNIDGRKVGSVNQESTEESAEGLGKEVDWNLTPRESSEQSQNQSDLKERIRLQIDSRPRTTNCWVDMSSRYVNSRPYT